MKEMFNNLMINYKTHGIIQAVKMHLNQTIENEQKKIKEKKETRDEHSECFERDREKEQGNGEKDLQNNTN